MSNNKKVVPAVLLLSVFALLLSLEVVVTPVFCYKDNGAVDFELTVMDMLCGCTGVQNHENHNDSHKSTSEPTFRCGVACSFNPCLDLPLDSSWLQRNTNKIKIHPDRFKQISSIDQDQPQAIRPLYSRNSLILLSKFLIYAPSAADSDVLLC